MSKLRHVIVGMVGIGLVIGCAKNAWPIKQEQKLMTSGASMASVTTVRPQPKDALPAPQFLVQLDVYQLTVPFGSVSKNTAFWKRVNEDTLDINTHDILYLNGFRVGQAPIAEWDYFRSIIDENPAVSKHQTHMAMEAKSVEMPMKSQVVSQCMFVMKPPADSNGRTYDSCDNIMTLSFRPAPRKATDVRVKLCPMVRGLRKKLEATLLNGQREFQFVSPERLYDLRLETDVPLDSFLIVAPSEYARAPMSVGNAFLVKEGDTELEEQILIFVPRAAYERTVAVK